MTIDPDKLIAEHNERQRAKEIASILEAHARDVREGHHDGKPMTAAARRKLIVQALLIARIARIVRSNTP